MLCSIAVRVRAQFEGAVIMGISNALYVDITIRLSGRSHRHRP
jgi:hypothetical protein